MEWMGSCDGTSEYPSVCDVTDGYVRCDDAGEVVRSKLFLGHFERHRLGAPRRTKDQWKVHIVAINSGLKSLKSLKVGTCISCGLRAHTQKLISATPQFEIFDIIDNPGSITLQVSYSLTRYREER